MGIYLKKTQTIFIGRYANFVHFGPMILLGTWYNWRWAVLYSLSRNHLSSHRTNMIEVKKGVDFLIFCRPFISHPRLFITKSWKILCFVCLYQYTEATHIVNQWTSFLFWQDQQWFSGGIWAQSKDIDLTHFYPFSCEYIFSVRGRTEK